jgi:MFS family permease
VLQLLQPGIRVALLVGIALPFFQQATGITAVIYYGPRILERAGFALGSALGGQVSIGIVNMLFTLVAIWKIDKLGRKPLLQFGTLGVGLSLALLGLAFHCEMAGGLWLPLLLTFYVACFAASLGPVVWVVLSEIFPTRIRGRAMSIATFSLWAACAIMSQTFPHLLEYLGAAGVFWLYAAMSIPSVLFVYWFVPETRGKTLEQIESSWIPSTRSSIGHDPVAPATLPLIGCDCRRPRKD